jgi:hypothetical protein
MILAVVDAPKTASATKWETLILSEQFVATTFNDIVLMATNDGSM